MIINNIFGTPAWVREIETEYASYDTVSPAAFERLKEGLKKYKPGNPEVSIGIPVYNEEKSILKMLASFARMQSKYRVELVVINNNSKDRTREILDKLGVNAFDEHRQSISFARQAALTHAKGKFFLNADGDSIYPDGWIDTYADALKDPGIVCVYGTYSFIPGNSSSRFVMSLYEMVTRLAFIVRRNKMDFFNVLGFNFAFRREDGLKVGGFNTTRQRWSDGWMAMMLSEHGKIQRITAKTARVWTSDRRLVLDGGLFKAVTKRFRKEVERYTDTPDFHTELDNYKKLSK